MQKLSKEQLDSKFSLEACKKANNSCWYIFPNGKFFEFSLDAISFDGVRFYGSYKNQENYWIRIICLVHDLRNL